MNDVVDPQGLARQQVRGFWGSVKSATAKEFLEAVASGAAATILAILGTSLGWIGGGVLGIGVSVTVGLLRHLYSDNKELRKTADTLRLHATVARDNASRASEQKADIETRLHAAQEQLNAVQAYLGLSTLADLLKPLEGVGDAVTQVIRRTALQSTKTLRLLTTNGSVVGMSYEDQLRIAEFFVDQAGTTVWTTCLDKPSEFESRNFYYLDAFDRFTQRLSSQRPSSPRPAALDNDPPPIARIFVITHENLQAEVQGHQERLLDLYQRHLTWGRPFGPGAPEPEETMKLFLGEPCQFAQTCSRHKCGHPLITDFMVVDRRFVYGRISSDPAGTVTLGYTHDATGVGSYEQWYRELWNAHSLTLAQAVRSLATTYPQNRQSFESFLGQCDKRKERLKIERHYGDRFGPEQKSGIGFFLRVTSLMANATHFCVAVDRADRKAERPWKSWEKPPYDGFGLASKGAVEHGASFRRLFILQEWPESNEQEDVAKFITNFVSVGVSVGFLHINDLDVDSTTEKFDTDFVLVGLTGPENEMTVAAETLGFGLEQEPFEVKELRWDKNLIGPTGMRRLVGIFLRLWYKPEALRIGRMDQFTWFMSEIQKRAGTPGS